MPEELQERFNGYQLEVAIHQNCDTTEISKLVRKYNNHKAMNQAQKAFTYIDAFAREIREITNNRFFLDVYSYSQKGKLNGTFERIVGDMVLLCNYPDHYKKDTKQGFKWLNENACIHDFESLDNLLIRLTESMDGTTNVRLLFSSKNAYIFVAAFKAYTELGRNDKEFGDFLEWFVNGGNETEIDGKTWHEWDINHSTRDSGVVHGKLNYLVELIKLHCTEVEKVA